MPNDLSLQGLPELPQRATIAEVAAFLWRDNDVVALWIGGSLARGAGDPLSDVDFRVAVAPQHFDAWREPRFEQIFSSSPVVGQYQMAFGADALLHHLVLSNGDIFDFFVQSTEREPTSEPILVLGSRSEEFEHRLNACNRVPPVEMHTVDAETVRQLLVSFWIGSHKHRKVLYRNLDLMAPQGITRERNILLRLWYIEASGHDCGDMARQTIHSLTSVVRTIEQMIGPQALAIVGLPMRNRQELRAVIEHNREIVAQLGRRLAQKYAFAYPEALEATVLQGWQAAL